MILRNFTVLGLLCATCVLVFVHAADASIPRVCHGDKRDALRRFAEFHELATRVLYKTRSVSHQPRPFFNLAEDAANYIGQRGATGLLIFAWDESDLCLFFWTEGARSPDDYLYVRLPDAKAELIAQARTMSELVQTQTSVAGRLPRKRSMTAFETPDAPAVDPEVANDVLSTLIFPPQIRPALAKVEHLSIVPVGPIATIPLFMLKPQGDRRVAADLFSINILTLMEDIQEPSPSLHHRKENALIIGNPATRDSEWDFPDLPGAEEEARFAHSLFGGVTLTRQDATLARFEEFAPSADLIIVAAHGVSDNEKPLDGSFLALADARLSPRHIQSLSLDNRPLVVLSACQSGLGQALDAGVIGLARAFQIAGASNTVMSLWSVDDDATRFLMERFYRLLAEHEPAAALRLATLETKGRYPNPVQWAAFALFGGPME